MTTLVHHLAHTAAGAPPEDRITFVDGRERERALHWRTVYARARRAAGTLHAAGIRRGDRVGIVLPTAPTFLDALFGCQLLGAIPVPLYPPFRLGHLEEYVVRTAAMLRAVDAAGVITDRRAGRLLGRVLAAAPTRAGRIDAAALADGPDRPPADVLPDDLALVQFSSGTTTAPKPVALTHAQILANVAAILDFIPFDRGFKQVGCSWLPLYHDMGLIGCVFVALCGPGPLVLLPPEQFLARPHLWLRAIARHRVTVSPAPNFAYALCAERVTDAHLRGHDLSSWRLALNGAEPVAVGSLRAFSERFAPHGLRPEALTPVYGLAEATLAVTFSAPDRPFSAIRADRAALRQGRIAPGGDVELVSVGRPVRGFSIEIRGEDGRPLPDGAIGRLWVKGPSVMHGYLGGPPAPIRNGWLDTGDLGAIVEGELVITGRAKDVLVLRGENHLPHDIEQAVDDVEGIRTGCVVAVGDVGPDGERLVVFAEARRLEDGLADAVSRAVTRRTALTPALVVILEPGTIPRTSSGKLRRQETLRRWRDGTLLPPARVTPLHLAGALARSWLAGRRARP